MNENRDKLPYATLDDAAQAFRRQCIPDAASHEQTVAMLQAFHAGAAAMLGLVVESTRGGTMADKGARIVALGNELNAFAETTLLAARMRGRF